MPVRFDLPDLARRLDAILRDLGYEREDGHVDRERALRVISRRTMRPMSQNRFDNLHRGGGAAMTAEEAVQIADGLGFDVRRLLYEADRIPRRPERPRSLLDELDVIGSVMD